MEKAGEWVRGATDCVYSHILWRFFWVWEIHCDSFSTATLQQMFSDDTFCWEDFPASESCPELSTARADAKSKYDMIYFWLRAVSEGWHVGLWRFQRLQKDVGGGVFVSFAFTSCYWLGLDPASCAAQGIRCWTCWYQTGYKLCSCDDCPETGVMEMNCCRNWNSGYIGLPIFFSRFSEEIRRC